MPFGEIEKDVIAGGFAGALSRSVTAPFDVVKIRFQLQFQKNKSISIIQAFRNILKQEGILSLWKGNLSANYLWVSYAMIQFGVYGTLKRCTEKKYFSYLSENTHHRSFSFFAGAFAGMVATAITYPFDIMRTQFAIQKNSKLYKSIFSFIDVTFRTKGLHGFYGGHSAALISIAPSMGLNFFFYELFNTIIYKNIKKEPIIQFTDENKSSTLINGICGGMAGGASKLIVFPLDTMKKRLQVQTLNYALEDYGLIPKYSGIFDCFKKTIATEGIQGFYRGLTPAIVKSVVATAITFAAYEEARQTLS